MREAAMRAAARPHPRRSLPTADDGGRSERTDGEDATPPAGGAPGDLDTLHTYAL